MFEVQSTPILASICQKLVKVMVTNLDILPESTQSKMDVVFWPTHGCVGLSDTTRIVLYGAWLPSKGVTVRITIRIKQVRTKMRLKEGRKIESQEETSQICSQVTCCKSFAGLLQIVCRLFAGFLQFHGLKQKTHNRRANGRRD